MIIMLLNLVRVTPILSCHTGLVLYSKGPYLDQALSCSPFYRAVLTRSYQAGPARFTTLDISPVYFVTENPTKFSP